MKTNAKKSKAVTAKQKQLKAPPATMANDTLIDTESGESSSETTKWVGPSCARHGAYTFYKGVRFEWHAPELVPNATRARPRRSSQSRAALYDRNGGGGERILAISDTFFVRTGESEPTCIGELMLLWHDSTNSEDLAMLRLYYVPETTPAGRQNDHGEHEVLAVHDKITIRTTDLPQWVVELEEWNYGLTFLLPASPDTPPNEVRVVDVFSPKVCNIYMQRTNLNLDVVNKEKFELLKTSVCEKHMDYLIRAVGAASIKDEEDLSSMEVDVQQADTSKLMTDNNNNNHKVEESDKPTSSHIATTFSSTSVPNSTTVNTVSNNITSANTNNHFCRKCDNFKRMRRKVEVIVLRFDEYCRYRATFKRFEDRELCRTCVTTGRKRVVFARNSFQYPQLMQNPLVCEEYAPVFKGRPRKRKKNKHQRFTRTKTHKTAAKSANDEENSSSRTARRKSGRTRHQTNKQEIQSHVIYDAMFDGQDDDASPKSNATSERRGRANSTSSSSASDNQQNKQQNSRGKDLRRSKRRRKDCKNSDLKIALQNSLLDVGPNHPGTGAVTDSQGAEATKGDDDKAPRKRKTSTSSNEKNNDVATTSGNSRKRKRWSSTSSISSSSANSPTSVNNDDNSPASPSSSSVKSSSSYNDAPHPDYPELDAAMQDFDVNNKDSFTQVLMQFMHLNGTPIVKIPSLGFKKLDLYDFYQFVQKEGGYQKVTYTKMWRKIYGLTGSHPQSTSAATCTRRHYEKLLLPFERYLNKSRELKCKRAKRSTSAKSSGSSSGGRKPSKKTTAAKPSDQANTASPSQNPAEHDTTSLVKPAEEKSEQVAESSKNGHDQPTTGIDNKTTSDPTAPVAAITSVDKVVNKPPLPIPAPDTSSVTAANIQTDTKPAPQVDDDVQPLDLSMPKRASSSTVDSGRGASTTQSSFPPPLHDYKNASVAWQKSPIENEWLNRLNAAKKQQHISDNSFAGKETGKVASHSSNNNGMKVHPATPVHAVKPMTTVTTAAPPPALDPFKQMRAVLPQLINNQVHSAWPMVAPPRETATVHPLPRIPTNSQQQQQAISRAGEQRQQFPRINSEPQQSMTLSKPMVKPVSSQQQAPTTTTSVKLNSVGSRRIHKDPSSSSHGGTGVETSNAARTYYRPTSMLAQHRQHQRQTHQQQQQNGTVVAPVPNPQQPPPVKDDSAATFQQKDYKVLQAAPVLTPAQQQQQLLLGIPPSVFADLNAQQQKQQQRVLTAPPKNKPQSQQAQVPSSPSQKSNKQELEKQRAAQSGSSRTPLVQLPPPTKFPTLPIMNQQCMQPNGAQPQHADVINMLSQNASRENKDNKNTFQQQQQRNSFVANKSNHLPLPSNAHHHHQQQLFAAHAAAEYHHRRSKSNEQLIAAAAASRMRSHEEGSGQHKLIFPHINPTPPPPSAHHLHHHNTPPPVPVVQQQQRSAATSSTVGKQQPVAPMTNLHKTISEVVQRTIAPPPLPTSTPSNGMEANRHQRSNSNVMLPRHNQQQPPRLLQQQTNKHVESSGAKKRASAANNMSMLTPHPGSDDQKQQSLPSPPKRQRLINSNGAEHSGKTEVTSNMCWQRRDTATSNLLNYNEQLQRNMLMQMGIPLAQQPQSQLTSNKRTQPPETKPQVANNATLASQQQRQRSDSRNHLARLSSEGRATPSSKNGSEMTSTSSRHLSFGVDRLTSPSPHHQYHQQPATKHEPHQPSVAPRTSVATSNEQETKSKAATVEQQHRAPARPDSRPPQPSTHHHHHHQQQVAAATAAAYLQGLPASAIPSFAAMQYRAALMNPLGLIPGVHPAASGALQPAMMPPAATTPEQEAQFLEHYMLMRLMPSVMLPVTASVAGHRLPENGARNLAGGLPLPFDPALQQSLPQNTAPFIAAMQNPSNRNQQATRPPNYRYQQ